MKLNLGCGQIKVPWSEWINVDISPAVRPDVCEDVVTLPSFQPGTIEEIYAGHLLEHVVDVRAAVLRWRELLKLGGALTVTTPDMWKSNQLWYQMQYFPVIGQPPTAGILNVATGFCSQEEYQSALATDPLGCEAQKHRRVFDAGLLMFVLQACRFDEVREINEYQCAAAPKFMSGEPVSWQCMVTGKKLTYD